MNAPTPAAPRPPKNPALRRLAIWVEYHGASFAGWQYQDNAHTVQAALEEAITRRFGEKRRVGGASRTDAGVHARGQVAVFDLAYPILPRRLVTALNSALPRPIRVIQARRMPAGWDPRSAAIRKTYSYLIFNRPVSSPFWEGRAWPIFHKLDLAAMRAASQVLLGRHDFSSFRAAGCEASHAMRRISALTITRRLDLMTIRITADAFLYHMVRNIVGTLVEVGQGRRTVKQMKALLAARDRRQAGPTAPAYGLYLDRVDF